MSASELVARAGAAWERCFYGMSDVDGRVLALLRIGFSLLILQDPADGHVDGADAHREGDGEHERHEETRQQHGKSRPGDEVRAATPCRARHPRSSRRRSR
jgi:hypothetical protein